MAAENYDNLNIDDETIRITNLTNVCRMLVTRGYMDYKKYQSTDEVKQTKSSVIGPAYDNLNNDLFLPLVAERSDNGIYTIPLDVPYEDQRDGQGTLEFDGSRVIVKIVPQVLKDVGNSPILEDFFKTYTKYHKIIIFDGVSDKVYNTLIKKKNTEVFDRDALMIDLMSHEAAPISCNFVTREDISHIKNPKMAKIHENDPLIKYYNGKRGKILRVLRPSLNNSIEAAYRVIIEPKSYFH